MATPRRKPTPGLYPAREGGGWPTRPARHHIRLPACLIDAKLPAVGSAGGLREQTTVEKGIE